jgi:hypothetical protein
MSRNDFYLSWVIYKTVQFLLFEWCIVYYCCCLYFFEFSQTNLAVCQNTAFINKPCKCMVKVNHRSSCPMLKDASCLHINRCKRSMRILILRILLFWNMKGSCALILKEESIYTSSTWCVLLPPCCALMSWSKVNLAFDLFCCYYYLSQLRGNCAKWYSDPWYSRCVTPYRTITGCRDDPW